METALKVVVQLVTNLLIYLFTTWVVMILLNGFFPELGFWSFGAFVLAGMSIVNASIITMKVKVDSMW